MTEYGKKIGYALRAVRSLHSDTSKMLQDCDGTIGKGRASIFVNTVTREMTYHVKADQWMAEGVYRFYDASSDEAGLVEGLTVYFVNKNLLSDEPLLIVGQLKYHAEANVQMRDVCKEWDLWHAFFEWNKNHPLDEVLATASNDNARVEWTKVIGVPLYSIHKMSCVTDLMERVRQQKRS